jgi:transposase-like protein
VKRRPRAFWEGLVAELEGGASAADVARRHRVRETTLKWWRSQLRRESRRPRLLPVVAQIPALVLRRVEIEVGGVVLRAEEGTDVEYVAALARALGRAC